MKRWQRVLVEVFASPALGAIVFWLFGLIIRQVTRRSDHLRRLCESIHPARQGFARHRAKPKEGCVGKTNHEGFGFEPPT